MIYKATKSFKIEQTAFKHGDIVGTGNVGRGEFAPSKSCPCVECSHVAARLISGLIEEVGERDSKPDPAPPVEPDKATKTKAKK